ncbi:hypothetical protein CN110_35395 [Sinorhizobium meliloti]|nr:hypothetical protein CN162_35975 [Sinorhizobium meliloti]RVM77798.1 hypothetical protein CN122_34210 [Sinorhizobium meliloti]RVN61599.1 hypothetical protein CN110_35395 [Sinorhizobium meliloti]
MASGSSTDETGPPHRIPDSPRCAQPCGIRTLRSWRAGAMLELSIEVLCAAATISRFIGLSKYPKKYPATS